MQMLALSLGQYMAPRILMWQGWAAPHPLKPGRGVGTGERNGNHMARIAVYSIIEHMHKRIPAVIPATWVDDIPLRCYGGDNYVATNIVDAVCEVASGLQNSGLSLADKSVVSASRRELATRIHNGLQAKGIALKVRPKGCDLGIDTGFGARKATEEHSKRGR
eukprot:1682992-Karenia_brevis.AAC.1